MVYNASSSKCVRPGQFLSFYYYVIGIILEAFENGHSYNVNLCLCASRTLDKSKQKLNTCNSPMRNHLAQLGTSILMCSIETQIFKTTIVTFSSDP